MKMTLLIFATGTLLAALEANNVPGAWWIGLGFFLIFSRVFANL